MVNGHLTDAMLKPTGDGFSEIVVGLVELGKENTVEFRSGWGYYDLDMVHFEPSNPFPAPKGIDPTLVNHSASDAAKRLYKRLLSTYGKKIFSGQYNPEETKYIEQKTARSPAILGADFIEYSPSRLEHGSKPDNLTEKMIEQARKGKILTFSWHWNAPSGLIDKMIKDRNGKDVDARWYKGFYTNATTFDLADAISHPGSPTYNLLIRDINQIAVQLKKLQKADVPVLWRPLHEAEGGWFWWGAKGPEPFKKLWRLMYDRLTRVHKLNNLIWVYSSGTKPDWYPGDAYVDIVGVDGYPADHSDPLTGSWQELFGRFDGKKPLAITEFGGVPDPERMFFFGTRWLYWVSWVGDLGPKKEPDARLKHIYANPLVVSERS
jgi:mannan endo-1,4-beta-mannosidase